MVLSHIIEEQKYQLRFAKSNINSLPVGQYIHIDYLRGGVWCPIIDCYIDGVFLFGLDSIFYFHGTKGKPLNSDISAAPY